MPKQQPHINMDKMAVPSSRNLIGPNEAKRFKPQTFSLPGLPVVPFASSTLLLTHCAKTTQDERIGVGATVQRRHSKFSTFLYQLMLAVIILYCAIAISRYGPERDLTPASAALGNGGTVVPRAPLSDANSTTPHICKNGAREDIVDLGAALIAITPYGVLCPSTPFFFLCLAFFVAGICRFNSLHTEDLDLVNGYAWFIIPGWICLDWQNFFVSFQVTMPFVIWSATLLLPIAHWLFKTVSPEIYGRCRRFRRLQAEEFKKMMDGGRERVDDVEARREASERGDMEEEIDEETPLLRRTEGRTG